MTPKHEAKFDPKVPVRPNQKDEQKQRSRAAILASATALLRSRGLRASSVMEVMKGAGLTVGGFYGHFDSKEELFVESLRSSAGDLWDRLVARATGATPHARLLSMVGRYLSRSHRDQPDTGCPLPAVAHEIARVGEPYRQTLADELTRVASAVEPALDGDESPRDTALGLIALMVGSLSLARALAGTPLSDAFLRAGKRLAERVLAADAKP